MTDICVYNITLIHQLKEAAALAHAMKNQHYCRPLKIIPCDLKSSTHDRFGPITINKQALESVLCHLTEPSSSLGHFSHSHLSLSNRAAPMETIGGAFNLHCCSCDLCLNHCVCVLGCFGTTGQNGRILLQFSCTTWYRSWEPKISFYSIRFNSYLIRPSEKYSSCLLLLSHPLYIFLRITTVL